MSSGGTTACVRVRRVRPSTGMWRIPPVRRTNIIGGASFLGGRGHIGHALIGAVMIGVIRNALNLLDVDVFFQMIAIGLIIVVAVEADVLRSRLEARARSIQAAGAP